MKHDIIVIGASAGGIEALQQVVRGLTPDLPASVFVVLHIPPWHRSALPEILSRSGPIPAVPASPDQPIEPGRIYVAPPDHHLLLEDGKVHVWRGPKENTHRPAVNPLFRSAAVDFKQRVTGVVLSGTLDDGATGLWWVKRYGGAAVVQDPRTAAFPDMPRNALTQVDVDYVRAASDIGPLLVELATNGTAIQAGPPFALRPEEEPFEWKRNRL